MKIHVATVFVDDHAKALDFYTPLGFRLKREFPLGKHRWPTMTPAEAPDGVERLLESRERPAVPPFKPSLMADGVPAASFQVVDLDSDFERLRGLGVEFVQDPMAAGPVKMAVLDDTCGNLIQLVQMIEA